MRENTADSVTFIAYMATIGALATALMACAVIFIMVIVVILKRSEAKIQVALEQFSRVEGTIRTVHIEQTYNYATGSPPSDSAVNTEDNGAQYENVTDSLPSVNDINTQENIAYGHTNKPTAVL